MKKKIPYVLNALKFQTLVFLFAFLCGSMLLNSCKKEIDDELQSVKVRVLDPKGNPLGGATVFVSGRSEFDQKTSARTNVDGYALLMVPIGNQQLTAKIGSVFKTVFNVDVKKSDGVVEPPPVKVAQIPLLKLLVIKAFAEQLEDVLVKIGITEFDTVNIFWMRDLCVNYPDSAKAFLKQYTLVFSDCAGSESNQFSYEIAPIFKDYLLAGGKLYGGHYNYMNLRDIFPGSYLNNCWGEHDEDSITVGFPEVGNYLGFSSAKWNPSLNNGETEPRRLNTYQSFRDIPNNTLVPSITYLVVSHVQPAIPAVVESHLGLGKYVHTIYHNQDIIEDERLLPLVKFILFTL